MLDEGGDAVVTETTEDGVEKDGSPQVEGTGQPAEGQPIEGEAEATASKKGKGGKGSKKGRKSKSKKAAKEPEASEAEDPEGEDAENAENVASESEPSADEAVHAPLIELTDEELVAGVSALVFASPDPLSLARLCALVGAPKARVTEALAAVEEQLQGLGVGLVAIAGGYQLMTRPVTAEVVQRLFAERKAEKVSPAALETLAVVAYRQPVTKGEIEAIRGVQAGPILRNLVDRGLIKVTGRADVPGHPLQYGTTRAFLDRFGLESLEDLPRDGELSAG